MESSVPDRILDSAIQEEIAAARRYLELAARATRDDVRELLESLAAEEEKHRQALEQVRAGDLTPFASPGPSQELLLAPSCEIELGPDATIARALLVAIDLEQAAFRRYTALARHAQDPGVRTLLEMLARQETGHWKRLEEAYERVIRDEAPASD